MDQCRPSTWQAANGAPSGPAARMLRTFHDVPEVIAHAAPASGSRTTPIGTTCGVPSGRSVVTVQSRRSRQKSRKAGEDGNAVVVTRPSCRVAV